MRHARIILVLAGLLALGLVALTSIGGPARAVSWTGLDGGVASLAPIATPVAVWKDCQEIALCTGCRAVYKCRSCTYKRTCAGGLCSWGDVCVWGPYVRVLPRGARIIRR